MVNNEAIVAELGKHPYTPDDKITFGGASHYCKVFKLGSGKIEIVYKSGNAGAICEAMSTTECIDKNGIIVDGTDVYVLKETSPRGTFARYVVLETNGGVQLKGIVDASSISLEKVEIVKGDSVLKTSFDTSSMNIHDKVSIDNVEYEKIHIDEVLNKDVVNATTKPWWKQDFRIYSRGDSNQSQDSYAWLYLGYKDANEQSTTFSCNFTLTTDVCVSFTGKMNATIKCGGDGFYDSLTSLVVSAVPTAEWNIMVNNVGTISNNIADLYDFTMYSFKQSDNTYKLYLVVKDKLAYDGHGRKFPKLVITDFIADDHFNFNSQVALRSGFYLPFESQNGRVLPDLFLNATNTQKNNRVVFTKSEIIGCDFEAKEIKNVKKDSVFTFALFTDIHHCENNMMRIVDACNRIGVDALVNCGDVCVSTNTSSYDWYSTYVKRSASPVLTAYGNHDCWTAIAGNVPTWDERLSVYNKMMPITLQSCPTIVQPADASTTGYFDYYKDFGSIRVIVIDGCHYWDATSKTWFEGVLANAKSNSKKVICVSHYPFIKTKAQNLENDAGWQTWYKYQSVSITEDEFKLEEQAVACVTSFIEDGGTFIGWFTGHTHQDNTIVHADDNNQFMLNSASSKWNNHRDGASSDGIVADDGLYDCFSIVGVDTTHGWIKFTRIGWNQDSAMRVRKSFAWDYVNHKIV